MNRLIGYRAGAALLLLCLGNGCMRYRLLPDLPPPDPDTAVEKPFAGWPGRRTRHSVTFPARSTRWTIQTGGDHAALDILANEPWTGGSAVRINQRAAGSKMIQFKPESAAISKPVDTIEVWARINGENEPALFTCTLSDSSGRLISIPLGRVYTNWTLLHRKLDASFRSENRYPIQVEHLECHFEGHEGTNTLFVTDLSFYNQMHDVIRSRARPALPPDRRHPRTAGLFNAPATALSAWPACPWPKPDAALQTVTQPARGVYEWQPFDFENPPVIRFTATRGLAGFTLLPADGTVLQMFGQAPDPDTPAGEVIHRLDNAGTVSADYANGRQLRAYVSGAALMVEIYEPAFAGALPVGSARVSASGKDRAVMTAQPGRLYPLIDIQTVSAEHTNSPPLFTASGIDWIYANASAVTPDRTLVYNTDESGRARALNERLIFTAGRRLDDLIPQSGEQSEADAFVQSLWIDRNVAALLKATWPALENWLTPRQTLVDLNTHHAVTDSLFYGHPAQTTWADTEAALSADGNWRAGINGTYQFKPSLFATNVIKRAITHDGARAAFSLQTAIPYPWEWTDHDARIPGSGSYGQTALLTAESLRLLRKRTGRPLLIRGPGAWLYHQTADGLVLSDSESPLTHPFIYHRFLAPSTLLFSKDTPSLNESGLYDALSRELWRGGLFLPGPARSLNDLLSAVFLPYSIQTDRLYRSPQQAAVMRGGQWKDISLTATTAMSTGQFYLYYAGGGEAWINRHPTASWQVQIAEEDIELPPFGWFFHTDRHISCSVVRQGGRIDYSRGDGFIYFNTAGHQAAYRGIEADGPVLVLFDYPEPEGFTILAPPPTTSVVLDTQSWPEPLRNAAKELAAQPGLSRQDERVHWRPTGERLLQSHPAGL